MGTNGFLGRAATGEGLILCLTGFVLFVLVPAMKTANTNQFLLILGIIAAVCICLVLIVIFRMAIVRP